MPKNDTDTISPVIKSIESLYAFLQNQNGRQVDLSKERMFVQEPFLHQNTETMTEEESAAFERENKQLFDFLRTIDNEIENIFK